MIEDTIITVLITGVTQVIKKSGVPNRYLPLGSIIIGIVFALGNGFTFDNAIKGVILGLAASGLYRGAQVTVNGK